MPSGRIRRLLLSYATAGLSKSVAIAVQIIALPVVAASLGAERFGALMVLGAMGAAFCMPARGVPPSLAIAIAHCRGARDPNGVAAQIWAAAIVSLLLGLGVLLLLAGLTAMFGPTLLLGGASGPSVADLNGAVIAFVGLVFATYGLAWVEGVRTGFEQHHVNNLCSLAGSALALLGIALAAAFAPTVTAFFVAIYVVYPLVQLANLLLVVRSLPGRRATSLAVVRRIARDSASWGVAQAGIILNFQGTVWLAAHFAGLPAGGVVGAVVRFFQLVTNVLLAILTPILPTLRQSLVAGDQAWASRAPRATTKLIGMALASFGIIVALFGDRLLHLWLGLDSNIHQLVFVAFGVLAVANIAPQLFYLVLMALGARGPASRNLLLGGFCGTALGLLAIRDFGLAGLIWGQALGMLFAAAIPNTILVYRRLRS